MNNIIKSHVTAAMHPMLISFMNPKLGFLLISFIVEFYRCRLVKTLSCFALMSYITLESRLRSCPIYVAWVLKIFMSSNISSLIRSSCYSSSCSACTCILPNYLIFFYPSSYLLAFAASSSMSWFKLFFKVWAISLFYWPNDSSSLQAFALKIYISFVIL